MRTQNAGGPQPVLGVAIACALFLVTITVPRGEMARIGFAGWVVVAGIFGVVQVRRWRRFARDHIGLCPPGATRPTHVLFELLLCLMLMTALTASAAVHEMGRGYEVAATVWVAGGLLVLVAFVQLLLLWRGRVS